MRQILAIFLTLALFSAPVFSQKKDSYRVRTVVIDPGHGGAKPGAQGARVQEKALTLSIAKKFGKLITDNYPNVKVIYTRTTDVDISLAERAHIANRNKADLFISIHANSHPTSSPTGVETFVMGLSESRANLAVAQKENADILLEADYKTNADYKDFDPNSPESYVMLTMFQNAYLDKSLNFAQAIQNQYKQNLKTINRGVKQAELYVLYKTTCPSVLTEVGFISNPTEEAFMISDEGQAKIAISLFNAFMNFKATEEGTNKIANPKIDIPGAPKSKGSKSTQQETPVATDKPVAKADDKPVDTPEPAAPPRDLSQRVTPVEQLPAQPEPKADPKPESKAEPKPEPKAEPKPEPKAEPKPEPKPEPKAEPKPEPKPEPKAEPKPEPKAEPKPEPKAEPKPEPKTTPKDSGVKGLQTPDNTGDNADEFFTVQFLTAGEELYEGASAFKGLTEVMVTRNGKLYCYSVGRFATFAEANSYCKQVQQNTPFKDAWPLRRHADKVTPVNAAPAGSVTKPAENPEPAVAKTDKPAPKAQPAQEDKPAKTEPAKATQPNTKGTYYAVQFCTSHRTFKAGAPEMHGIKDFRYTKSGQVYIYTAGNYNSVAEARKRCAAIKNSTPFKDAFVVGYKNGKKFIVD